MDKYPTVDRSGTFMLYFQADGLCQGLRLGLQFGHPLGPKTVELLIELIADAKAACNGKPIERLPDVSTDSAVIDVLVAAEVLRCTVQAFLTPEEVEQQRRQIGFKEP